jgi:hypothetical protein
VNGRATQARPLVGSRTQALAMKGLRICSAAGCTTRISMYNHAKTCFLHSDVPARERPARA